MAPIATLAIMCTAPAQTYGVSVFTPFIRETLGLTPAEVAGAYMMGTLLASLPLTLIGTFMDRYGPRLATTIVVIGVVSACWLLARATGLVSLFFAFFLLRLFGQGSLGMMSQNTLAFWFSRRLGFVSGLNATGAALTIAFAPRIHFFLTQQVGWRISYALLGLMIALLLLPMLLLFYRNHPEDVGQRMEDEGTVRLGVVPNPDSSETPSGWTFALAIRTPAYWITAACVATWALVGTAVAFCAPSIFEMRGLVAAEAAARTTHIFTAMGLTLVAANVFTGMLADRLQLQHMMAAGMFATVLVGALLRLPDSEHWVIAIGIVMGLAQALMMAIGATVWVRYFGREALGRIRGSVMTILVASSSVGPFLLEGVAAWLGDYQGVLTMMMLFPLPLAFAVLWKGRKPVYPA